MATKLFVRLVVLFGLIQSIAGECPNMRDVPVMYDDNKFMCAVRWRGAGNEYPVEACNNCEADEPDYFIYDGEDGEYEASSHYAMGSLLVKPGCIFYVYWGEDGPEDAIEPGLYTDFGGPLPSGGGCGSGWSNYKCRCSMEPVACTPEDGYESVIQCDNSESIEITECNYAKTIGTSFSDTISESMSIDTTIEASMKASFFGLFEASLGVSTTTGYDWTHTTDVTMSEQVTVEVKASVKPGFILQIKQAVGKCGGSQAKTELFKIVHIEGKSGRIAQVEYEWTDFKNATSVLAD